MKKEHLTPVLAVMVAGLMVLSACGAPAPQNPNNPAPADVTPTPAQPARVGLSTPEKVNVEVGPDEPQIFMLEPEDGDTVNSPFFLRIGTANLQVPLLSATVHISIDAPCLAAGETFTKDEQHFSLPVGKWSEPRFALPDGNHRLCIQVSDSQNTLLAGPGLTRIIDLEVLPAHPASK
jgi:hypothetical protein